MTFEEYVAKKGFPLNSTQQPLWRECWETAWREGNTAAKKPDFEIVVEGLVLLGARCPKCRHLSRPVLGANVKCPQCGYTKEYAP